MVIQNHLRYI